MTTHIDVSVRQSRVRAALAAVLLIAGLLLAPLAAIGSWARVHLVDTDHFVSTFAPLADDEAVQDFVADQIVGQVEQQVDLPRVVGNLFARIPSDSGPTAARAAIDALQGPAVAGIRSLLATTADQLVRSEQFAGLWKQSLRVTHRNVTAVLNADPDHLVQLADGGALTLAVDPMMESMKATLIDRGLTFLDRIDIKVRPIVLVESSDLDTTRTAYKAATVTGFWLPIASAALLVSGVLVANRRRRALTITAALFTVLFVALAVGLHFAGVTFVDAVSPDHAPVGVAETAWAHVTDLLVSSVRALAVLGAILAIASWFHGSSRIATAFRSVSAIGFERLRAALDANGGDTGRFGRFVNRLRPTIMGGATVVGLVLLLVFRPVTLSSVGWLFVMLAVVVVIVELVRRPPVTQPKDAAAAE
ncbi:hypothetical protein nbrc107696_13080 [Gordonia spumicola]|uniref:Integral membrane protein n=1 Tax=Gordonia spumicola TaxID=589161 RepID=A0A7I9V6P3_9ACTN|nr:hypothetical protein [Gordonia spumicola]GEE00862.1 hypothetical protein nbrc107696_13080 [Gordonia spumicola]